MRTLSQLFFDQLLTSLLLACINLSIEDTNRRARAENSV